MKACRPAPVTAQGAYDPNTAPAWEPSAPVTPWHLEAKTDWNRGAARVRLTWHGEANNWTYRVYRDGTLVADGLWGLTFLDTNVSAGEQHTYAVSGLNVMGGATMQSAASSGLSVTVDARRPALPASLPAVQILKVVPAGRQRSGVLPHGARPQWITVCMTFPSPAKSSTPVSAPARPA